MGIKNKLTKQAVKIHPDQAAHKEPSYLALHCLQMCVRIYLMSEYTRLYPNYEHLMSCVICNTET